MFTLHFHLYHSACTTGESGIEDPLQWLLNSANLWVDPVRIRTGHVDRLIERLLENLESNVT